ncbi:MAG: hypothetical protein NVSMB66_7540 [Candidatus Doudnabacteria bacterium]
MPIELCTVPGCPFFGRYCRAEHGVEKPVKEKKIYTIPKVAPNRKEENKEYEKEKKKYLKEHPLCEMRPGCKNLSTQIHHMKKRRTPDHRINPKWFRASCTGCNLWAESHPKQALELGICLKAID